MSDGAMELERTIQTQAGPMVPLDWIFCGHYYSDDALSALTALHPASGVCSRTGLKSRTRLYWYGGSQVVFYWAFFEAR